MRRIRSVLTVNGEVDPSTVGVVLVGSVEEDDGTLVPALVDGADVADLDRRLLHHTNASLVSLVDVRRVSVELYEDRHLLALLAPRHDVLRVQAARIVDVTVEDLTAADVGGFVDRTTCGTVHILKDCER